MLKFYDQNQINNIDRQLLIVKPEQSGKTQLMIDMMINNFETSENDFHILFCDNKILLVNQTHSRVTISLNGNREILHLSTSDKANVSSIHEVYSKIMDTTRPKKVGGLTMCSNHVRESDAEVLIHRLNREIEVGRLNIGKIYVWVDEADCYSNICNKIDTLQNIYPNLHLYMLTATPFDKLPQTVINVLPMDQTRSENYCGWNDSDLNLHIFDLDHMGTIEFADHILHANQHLIQPGKKFFIPAESLKESHKKMKDLLCNKYHFHTIIINGDGIIVYSPDGRLYDKYNKVSLPHDPSRVRKFDKNIDELLPILRRIYSELKLDQVPVAITGYICMGRGITIIAQDFQIDTGILSHAPDRPSASQMGGRLKKNGRQWENLVIPDVFTTKKFNQYAIDMETLSSTLAIVAKEKQQREGTTILNGDDIQSIYTDSSSVTTTKPIKATRRKKSDIEKDNILKNVQYDMCKCAIQLIPFNEDIKQAFGVETIKDLYKTKTNILYNRLCQYANIPEQYKNYNAHKWCIDTKPKFVKYGIEKRYNTGKSFYESVLYKKGKDENQPDMNENNKNYVIMYFVTYGNRNEIMISPWNGEAYQRQTSTVV